jgi:hypothetical protein
MALKWLWVAFPRAFPRGEGRLTMQRVGNVRKALDVVIAKLAKGGQEEKAFAEHLRASLSTGYECLYSQSQGRIWV